MVKLVVVDMDGTFLNDEKKISPEFPKVYERLKELGVNFCIASGRQIDSLKKEVGKLIDIKKEDGIFVSENGTVVEFRGEIVKVDEFDEKTGKNILKRLKDFPDKMVVVSTRSCSYIDCFDDEAKRNAELYLPNYRIVDDFEEIDEKPVKIAIYSRNGHDRGCEIIEDEFSRFAHVCTSGHEWMDIIPKNSNKGSGVGKIQELLNISDRETMAFGDQMNDYEMLNKVYYSYAMENGVDDVKKVARFIAPSNNEFGVVKVIKEHFGI